MDFYIIQGVYFVPNEEIYVTKRDGNRELFTEDKINNVVKWATEGIKGVNYTDVIIKATENIHDGMSTKEIHQALIRAAVNCFTIDAPNYQYVAARLLCFDLRKEIWKGINPPKFYDFLTSVVDKKQYDSIILEKYTEEEIDELEQYLDHDRDYLFTYAGFKQMLDKYLVQNRVTKEIYETPQFAFMSLAMTAFINYKEKRLDYIKRAYDVFSKFKANLPTPQIAGLRTPLRSFSSCSLINVGDSLESLGASNHAVMKAIASRYGIGINFGRIRPIGSPIRNGEVAHTGVIPFLKVFEATVKSCQQNGIRGGGATVNFMIWHPEIEDILSLKNNGGSEDNRVRQLDYCIQISKLFYERFIHDKEITLMSPHEVPDLYEAFGTPEFDKLYERYEKDISITRRKVSARKLFGLLLKERVETGRIYIMNIDHVNTHSSWGTKVEMLNLCVTGETRLSTNYGLMRAKDLYILGKNLDVTVDNRTIDGSFGSTILPSTQMFCTANQVPIYKVETDKGYTLRATENHDVFVQEIVKTAKGRKTNIIKKKLKDLQEGDRLLVQSGEGQFGSVGNYPLGFLVGLITSDGTYAICRGKDSVCIDLHNEKMDIINTVVEYKDQLINSYTDVKEVGKEYVNNFIPKLIEVSKTHRKYRIISRKLQLVFDKFGIGREMKTSVPEAIFQGTRECVKGYLQGIFSMDACVVSNIGKPHIQLTSISKKRLEETQILLSNFGIQSGIYKLKSKDGSRRFTYTRKNGEYVEYSSKQAYRLDITGRESEKFYKLIGFVGKNQNKTEELLKAGHLFRKENYVKIKKVSFDGIEDVYDVTQDKNNSVIFNGLVTGQCCEIVQPTKPISNIYANDDSESGVCILSAVNVNAIRDDKDLINTCDIIVRTLEALIDHQTYFCPAAERFTKKRRSLGVGINGLAGWLAKKGYKYTDKETPNRVSELQEKISYYLYNISVDLSKELGPCEKYNETKFSKGILPIDTYKRDLDSVVTEDPKMDWELLRERIEKYGIRHSTLTAQMPVESSSVVSNSTNGIEPPRDALSYKKSKMGSTPILVPGWEKYKKNYEFAYEIGDNTHLLNIAAAISKWLDMAISTNVYYRYADFPDGKLPDTLVMKDILYAYKMGIPTLYYCNTDTSEVIDDCESGACKI
jgi:ribonucleotide reductase alpha subunit